MDVSNRGKWKLPFDYYQQNCGGKYTFKSNLNKRDLKSMIKDDFIKEVFGIWAELKYQNVIEFLDDFSEQNFWNNSQIRIDDKLFYFQKSTFLNKIMY